MLELDRFQITSTLLPSAQVDQAIARLSALMTDFRAKRHRDSEGSDNESSSDSSDEDEMRRLPPGVLEVDKLDDCYNVFNMDAALSARLGPNLNNPNNTYTCLMFDISSPIPHLFSGRTDIWRDRDKCIELISYSFGTDLKTCVTPLFCLPTLVLRGRLPELELSVSTHTLRYSSPSSSALSLSFSLSLYMCMCLCV